MEPLSFIDSPNLRKHLLLVYDDVKEGQAVEFHFIKKGLENRESCVYLTHGPTKYVETEMRRYGIALDHFEQTNLLRIHQIPSPIDDSASILDGVNKILKMVLPNPSLPFRIVGRLVEDVGLEEAISIQACVEKNFHTGVFETVNGSVLCTYDISQIKANNEWKKWLALLQMYHHVYIASLEGKISVTMNQN
jgi:hypothetical protein